MGNIPNIIRTYRLKMNLSQRELAHTLGKSKNVISNWENGVNKPDADMIEKLCAILNIPVGNIFGEHEELNNKQIQSDLTERDLYALSLFKKLPDDEQLKFIGRLEVMTER
ncbi:XRE family transcriptional regulator [Desulfosporosinus fructosivorans]|uniref:XRE family transcriptional regulator n=1 Tax=Desulfosporosinus fructosivorans TaxID=2018669 RepID=A0A4Z0QZN2_9FIRM|nr:helix-turn-helix transcriptional regulator [Desulfosporosinus fructosivorans]TGE35924.1 XRE family transcriptional regulator [Desulfosporosinus fructosivorans]